LEKKGMEGQESAKGHQDQQLQWVFLVDIKLDVYFPHYFWHAWHMHVDYWSRSIIGMKDCLD